MTHRVFSYGTLRQPEVQRALYGREVPTFADSLPGFQLEWLVIKDPEVVRMSGTDRHPIVRLGQPADRVEGVYLELNDAELAATDAYEVDDYARRSVTLSSGVNVWAYLAFEA